MFRANMPKAQLVQILDSMDDRDYARFRYVQEMGGTYLAVAHFEDLLIGVMHMCDRVKVRRALGEDAERWEAFLGKRATLQASTLGSLISILEKHAIAPDDLRYLKWVKGRRDHFIHRWFHEYGWPGEHGAEDCRLLTRQLLAIQLWLQRAEHNVPAILERAGLMAVTRFEDGVLMTNLDLLDQFEPDAAERSMS